MALKEFTLITPVIEAASVFKALETAIPSETIKQAIGQTHSQQQRQRKLPSELVISLVIAMSLWSSVSMRTVLKNLVNGLSMKWIQLGEYWQVPSSSSISEARQRVGCRVMTQLFERVVHPMASPQTDGAFLGGLRVMAVDGTVIDVPDSPANARVFGYPGTRPGKGAAFPKVRLV
ncbi:transposase domain-containing protein, partial [Microcoleus sp. A6-C5]|uniref:transposase domain-containing protein n=1 Tax=Microcoleus sp. A6-C5 TaxID=2818547 RepID=UPI002FD02585